MQLYFFHPCSNERALPLFFFFQAEDGIRDRTVTGVQTCALPIFGLRAIASLSYGTRVAAPGRRTNATQILRTRKPAVGAPGEAADLTRSKATTAKTITEPRISTSRRAIRTGRSRSCRRLDSRPEQLIH